MKTFKVRVLNNFTFKGEGKLIIATNYLAKNVHHAMNQAFIDAIQWNKDANLKATQLICEGYYRNI